MANFWHSREIVVRSFSIILLASFVCACSLESRSEETYSYTTTMPDGIEIKAIIYGDDGKPITFEKSRPLHSAVQDGDAKKVDELLKSDKNINRLDFANRTPLHCAVMQGNAEIVVALLKAGASLDNRDVAGYTPLHYAAEAGSNAVLKLLLDAGAKTSIVDQKNELPVHKAIRKGYSEITRMLCPGARKPQITDGVALSDPAAAASLTMLMFKAESDYDPRSVDTLLQAGCPANATDSEGCTPLLRALDSGANDEVIRILVNAGADVNAILPLRASPSALHLAVMNHETEIVRLLLDHGARVNVLDQLGATPLFTAISCNRFDSARLLLQNGAEVNLGTGRSVLMFAMQSEIPQDILETIISKSGDISNTGAIQTAALSGRFETVKFILTKGADINSVSPEFDAPLHCACLTGQASTTIWLLENGANPNIRNSDGTTPLHIAASCIRNPALMRYAGSTVASEGIAQKFVQLAMYILPGQSRIGTVIYQYTVEALCKSKADVNARDSFGLTPLHRAVEGGNPDIIRILVSNGADSNLLDHKGRTPKAYAREILDGLVAFEKNNADGMNYSDRIYLDLLKPGLESVLKAF
ncbi:MAG: ankyrin repeat domain-containing protein [Candidatus Riflebacteria bacterium]|nr:ankyrin repeat domain-containing protein [Candidatus Riflebacteria bacterium]